MTIEGVLLLIWFALAMIGGAGFTAWVLSRFMPPEDVDR